MMQEAGVSPWRGSMIDPALRLEKITAPISTARRGGGDREAGAVVVLEADDGRQDQQRDQVHHLDQRVQRGAGGVLERVADGVAR